MQPAYFDYVLYHAYGATSKMIKQLKHPTDKWAQCCCRKLAVARFQEPDITGQMNDAKAITIKKTTFYEFGHGPSETPVRMYYMYLKEPLSPDRPTILILAMGNKKTQKEDWDTAIRNKRDYEDQVRRGQWINFKGDVNPIDDILKPYEPEPPQTTVAPVQQEPPDPAIDKWALQRQNRQRALDRAQQRRQKKEERKKQVTQTIKTNQEKTVSKRPLKTLIHHFKNYLNQRAPDDDCRIIEKSGTRRSLKDWLSRHNTEQPTAPSYRRDSADLEEFRNPPPPKRHKTYPESGTVRRYNERLSQKRNAER